MPAFIIIVVFAAVLGFLLWRLGVGQSRLEVRSADTHFPTVSGYNLDRQELEFPRDFAGELNLLFVPFLQQQQAVVNTWVPFAQELEATYPGVIYYELPTIEERGTMSRTFINEGMRAGIPDQTARERTITLYIDLERFMKAVDIPGKSDVHTLLVNRQGDILWRTTGVFNETKKDGLLAAVEAHR